MISSALVPWRQFSVGLDGFVAEAVEKEQNICQVVEELFLLLRPPAA
jgi:hypothetical protein